MKRLIFLAIIILTMGCNHKNDNIEKFWSWFADNQSLFEKIDSSNQDEKLDIILQHLHTISDGLSIEISDEFNGVRDMVISPEGNKAKFEIVKEIVNDAPSIKGWTFTAFRQPVNEDFTLQFEDIKFAPSEMFFYPIIDSDSLDLIIYSRNIQNHDFNTIAHYGLITMDNVLGEYDCVMKVRHYDFQDLDSEKDKTGLKPVTELKTFVDSFYKKHQNKNDL